MKIRFEELPDFYRQEYEKDTDGKKIQPSDNKPQLKSDVKFSSSKRSALFDLTIRDLISIQTDTRQAHPLHASDTSQNFSVSSDNDSIAHCWRHNVSLNAIQFLVVKSGYMDCKDAGTAHKGGSSMVTGDDGAIFHAWVEAKKSKVIPEDDPIPVRAMCYIAKKHKLCTDDLIPKRNEDKMLPVDVYNKVLAIVEEQY